jgi:iron complex outermembrane recepter protein
MSKTSYLLGSALGAMLMGGLAAPAAAQDAAEVAETTDAGEIIVTARRRDETAQQTPVAITVLNDALLDRYWVKGVNSIAQLTPGMFTGEASGSVGGSISLRGIGSGDSQPFIDQAISLNVDGVPISSAQLLRAAQLDLKQIEVLRGPQALFFGKNSPGGIISLISADPGYDLELMARGGYEFVAQEKYAEATLSVPIGETFGARVAGRYSRQNGYIVVDTSNQGGAIPSTLGRFPDQEEVFLRGTLAWTPTDAIRVRLKGTYTNTRINGGPSFFSDITACPYGQGQGPNDLPGNCFNDGRIQTAQLPPAILATDPIFEGNPNGYRRNKQGLVVGTVDFDLTDALTLTTVSGYYSIRERLGSNGGYGLGSVNAFTVLFNLDQITQEVRLRSSFDGPINFLAGGFYEHRELYTRTFIVVPLNGFQLPVESTNQKQESFSAFGQLLFRPVDQVEITVGGRYTHETKRLLDFTSAGIDVTQLPGYPGGPDPRLSFSDFSPEVTVSYRPTPDMMIFASYKQGFKSGGFDAGYTNGGLLTNPATPNVIPARRLAGQTFRPESVEGGEIGIKSQWMDRQLTMNLTGYWYDYKDLQVSSFDTTSRAFITLNAARARIKGLELETRYRPQGVPGLELHLSAAWNDAKFTEYLAPCYAGQTIALGCDAQFNLSADQSNPGAGAVTGTTAGGVTGLGFYTSQDLAGKRLRKAPEWSVNVGGYYEFALSPSLMSSLSLDLNYSSGYDTGTGYQPLAYQPAFAKLDATWRLFSQDKRWELAVIGRNLTNVRNLIAGIDRTGTGSNAARGSNLPSCTTNNSTPSGCAALSDIIGTPMQPRSVAVQVTFRY